MRAQEFILEGKGDVVSITPRGIKVRGMKQLLGVGDWVQITATGLQQKIIQIGKNSVKLEDGKIYGAANIRYPLDESINEGGWEDTITQKTKLTPAVIKTALKLVEKFTSDFNTFLKKKGEEPIKMGHPLGSTAYANVDDPDTEYGDIDMQMIAPTVEMTSAQLSKHYNTLVDEFLNTVQPSYYHNRNKPNNGHPIFNIGGDAFVQVDLLWTVERLSKWDRWRKTPMRGIKGLITGNLYSTLGEVINMSLQTAVLMKIKDGEPINYQRGRNADDVIEVTKDIENFGADILTHVFQAVNGSTKGMKVHKLLKSNPGLKTADVQITDLVQTVKGLAYSFEMNNLYGKYNLKEYSNAQDLINKYLAHYLDKADKAGRGAKLDKAETPAEHAMVKQLRAKIAKGVKIVKKAFAEA